ncbi:MAG: hypothetical protein P8Z79_14445 [Sedimentisphaerales bacterium]|jgi:hypothetical protein
MQKDAMTSYILAGAVVLAAKWTISLLFIVVYRSMGFHQPSPLTPFKEEIVRAVVNILSNIAAVYVLVIFFDELQPQPAMAMLVVPLIIGLLWSYYNLRRARQGIPPSRQVGMVFDRLREQVESQYGREIAESVAGEESKRRYLIRSECAYLASNVLGTILGAFLFLRKVAFF